MHTFTWCALLFLGFANAIPKNLLYDYKLNKSLPKGDDVSTAAISLKIPIVFYGTSYDSIYINSNGILSFNTDLSAFFNIEFPLDYPIIAPLYSNVDTTGAGDIYYLETADRGTIARADTTIWDAFPDFSNFRTKSVFIVTWLDVGYHTNGADKKNTFQVAIYSDGYDSFVEFLYADNGIQWIQSLGDESGLPDARAQAGFASFDGRFYNLPGTGTDQIVYLDRRSNMNLPGQWLYRIGNIERDANIETPNAHNSRSVENFVPTTCSTASTYCNIQAKCVDYEQGFCCHCRKGFYGNGKTCIKKDVPLRVNGKVNLKMKDEVINNIDLQSYVVMADARAYTAMSKIPEAIGGDMQTIQVMGATIAWLFAKPVGESLNGFQLTGGIFNHTVSIKFPNTNQDVLIRQKYLGLDAFGQLKLEAEISGEAPAIPADKQLSMNEYQEQYTITAPGIIQSSSNHLFTYEHFGEEIEVPYQIEQNFIFSYCEAKQVNVGTTWKMKSGKNFIGYEAKEQIIRFGLSSKIGPLGDIDPCDAGRETCGTHSSCVVEDDSFRCVCNPGYQQLYINNEEICEDINECTHGIHDCDYNAQCYNEEGTFRCICNPGFEGNGRVCENARNCDNVTCNANAECVHDRSIAKCACLPGFAGNGFVCAPIQTQSCNIANNCSPYGFCSISQESNLYSCHCLPLYEGDGYECTPRPTEPPTTTLLVPTEPPPERQTPIPSNYVAEQCFLGRCWCPQGYEKIGSSEYCAPLSNSPKEDAQADRQTPIPSNYLTEQCFLGRCWCPQGYEKIGLSEYCAPLSNTLPTQSPPERQTPIPSNYVTEQCFLGRCWCPQGYEKIGSSEYCAPLSNTPKEDAQLGSLIIPEVECFNSTLCFCPSGYILQVHDNLCLPVVELKTMGYSGVNYSCNTLNDCHVEAQCLFMKNGHYQCVCNNGFTGNGYKCVELEESCLQQDDLCDIHAACLYDEDFGKSICKCSDGYQGDGLSCTAMPICRNNYDCYENEECRFSRLADGYDCICKEGWGRDSQNLCVRLEGTCGGGKCVENAECLFDDVENLHYCQCKSGYEGDAITKCTPKPVTCNMVNNCGLHATCEYSPDSGYMCKCDEGFVGDGIVCYVEQTCHVDPRLCDRNARCVTDANRRYTCECNPGFDGNGTVCYEKLKHEGNFLLVNQGIATLKLSFDPNKKDGRPIQLKYSQLAVGLDVDCVGGRIYWSDINLKAIRSASYNGSDKEDFITTNIGSAEGLAIDWVARNIYWTDSTKDTIEVANVETKLRKVLINTNLVNPRGIAVHPQRGKIFWSDWNRASPKIEWANEDGTGREIFMQGHDFVGLPNSLTVDYYGEQLCYADAGIKKIICVDIDSRQPYVMAFNCSYPFGIAVTPEHIYWSDWISKRIERVEKHSLKRLDPLKVPLGGTGNKLYSLVSVPHSCPGLTNLCYYYKDQCPSNRICFPDGKNSRNCLCGDEINSTEPSTCSESNEV